MVKPKRIFFIILCLFYIVLYFQVNAAANKDISVKFNGIDLNLTNKPKIVNDRLLVSAVDLIEKLGATLEWKSDTSSILICSNIQDNRVVLMKIGQTAAIVNGVEYELDAAPAIYNKRTYVPLSFISECLGAKVSWDGKSKNVNITYQIPIREEPPKLVPPWENYTTSEPSITY